MQEARCDVTDGIGKVGGSGDSEDSSGGGVYDGFTGTLKLSHCDIVANAVLDGAGGHRGRDSEGSGGGLYIAPDATAEATADTDILGNRADHDSDVYGHLGTI